MSTAPAAQRVRGPVITAWSAVSPYGIGHAAFTDGVREGRSTDSPVDAETWQSPDERACLVPDFDIRAVLGKASTRSMDRVTGLAVTAVRELFAEAEAAQNPVPAGAGTALVLGTTLGSAQSQHDFVRASFEEAKPYDVDPRRMPNTLMNCAAAATAIRFDLKGPNSTVAGGRMSGLLALGYARRLLAAGRTERALVGAVEEYSRSRAWIDRHSRGADDDRGDRPGALLGEGCAMLLLEPAAGESEGAGAAAQPDGAEGHARTALAELLAIDIRADVRDDPAATLRESIAHALGEAGVTPDQVWAATAGELPGPLGADERRLLTEVFGEPVTARGRGHELLGDTAAVSGIFQLTTLLVRAAEEAEAADRFAVITSVDEYGMIACAVLRLPAQNGGS
ncbi:3-oxoacyl-ACP synthase [Streptomyces armeniacus]|uniref:3-oxoacyl-ACP synthase n=1 Tax=Streptomyces armeniacus TaxID=83291 RepID=A0A345XPI2_9ACTN|nr:beta-ketoacyl synthase N-terminal-like domain-containing protein [Streptomyces armeniacus]AXK33548.1 3-oxoacyl-ACP synthase [Streptomyces armeniacus]